MHWIDLIWSPSKEFKRITKTPAWVYYLAILAFGYWLLAYWMDPFMKKAAELQLADFLELEELAEMRNSSNPWRLLGLLTAPVIVLLKSSIYALIATSLMALRGMALDFKRTLTAILASSSVFLFEGAMNVVILYGRGLENLQNPRDLSPPIGLDLLIDSSDAFFRSVLGNLNIFEAWYLLLLTVGLATVGALKLRESVAVAGVLWSIGILAEARLQSFLENINQAFM